MWILLTHYQVLIWTYSLSLFLNAAAPLAIISFFLWLQRKLIVNPPWLRGTGERLLSVTLSVRTYQLLLSHLLLDCLSRPACSLLKCPWALRWWGGTRGFLTLFTVTIHSWTDFAILLSRVWSLQSFGGSQEILWKITRLRKKGEPGFTRGIALNVYFWWRNELKRCTSLLIDRRHFCFVHSDLLSEASTFGVCFLTFVLPSLSKKKERWFFYSGSLF